MAIAVEAWTPTVRRSGPLARLFDWKPFLILLCMLPCAALLLTFLTYPLGLGVWLAFTDAQIGQPGEFIGLFNYQMLWEDNVFWLVVFNTIFYTTVATIGKFALGLWLALLLNNSLPFKSFIRAIVLIPWIVPTVLSAIAFWWIYDPQFSIVSYLLVDVLHWRSNYVNFLGDPWNARFSLIAAYAITRGGPVNATHLMATLAFQRAISGGQLGEGAAIAVAMIPFLIFATLFSYFALANRKWQQGGRDD
ncbi:MAG: sugar ABC transporter permease [Bradyrhizobium sp.]|nr:sugar ABC transporter permease [Bradyrhizobium sp.]